MELRRRRVALAPLRGHARSTGSSTAVVGDPARDASSVRPRRRRPCRCSSSPTSCWRVGLFGQTLGNLAARTHASSGRTTTVRPGSAPGSSVGWFPLRPTVLALVASSFGTDLPLGALAFLWTLAVYLPVLRGPSHRGLHDRAAGVIVIDDRQAPANARAPATTSIATTSRARGRCGSSLRSTASIIAARFSSSDLMRFGEHRAERDLLLLGPRVGLPELASGGTPSSSGRTPARPSPG